MGKIAEGNFWRLPIDNGPWFELPEGIFHAGRPYGKTGYEMERLPLYVVKFALDLPKKQKNLLRGIETGQAGMFPLCLRTPKSGV